MFPFSNLKEDYLAVQLQLDEVFFNEGPDEFRSKPRSNYNPYEVTTKRSGDSVIVSSQGFFKEIPMKDTLWMRLNGYTWESKVTQAQSDAFQSSYKYIKDQSNLDYQVSRLK